MNKIKPLKRLGQNFLVDKKVVKKVISELKKNKELSSPRGAKLLVLEIGPGLGALTKELAKLPIKILAVEKDPRMCQILGAKLREFKNVKIVNQDILKLTENSSLSADRELFSEKLKIVANLPFYISAPVIRKFLETNPPVGGPPKEMLLIVQKEVAQRICAKPPKMNLLAVSVQFYAEPKIISYVSKKSFRPSPKVDGAILKISTFNRRRKSAFNQRFFRIVKAGFSHPRKQLVNNLSKGLALSSPNGLKLNKGKLSSLLLENNIKPSQRAETLTINDWIKLTKVL